MKKKIKSTQKARKKSCKYANWNKEQSKEVLLDTVKEVSQEECLNDSSN